MKINAINYNNQNFKARWSEETLTKAAGIDKKEGTNLQKELIEALEKNPVLKNYGGDDAILTIGCKRNGLDIFNDTFCITRDIKGHKLTAVVAPIPDKNGYIACRHSSPYNEPLEGRILYDMAKYPDIKDQVLRTVAKSKNNLSAGFIDSIGWFFDECRLNLSNSQKSKMFDEWFGSGK